MDDGSEWRDLTFVERSAVVTGAGRGIGRAIAYRLTGLGARTVIWDRDRDVVEQTAAEPSDIADVAAFLASEWAGFITGQTILVDGGRMYQ